MQRTGSPDAEAWHEAGHALVAHWLGGRVVSLSLEVDDDGFDGRASVEWRRLAADEISDRSGRVALGGPLAELVFQGDVDPTDAATVSAWEDDWREVQRCAEQLDADPAARERRIQSWVREVQERFEDLRAQETLARIADALDAHGTLDETLFEECLVGLG